MVVLAELSGVRVLTEHSSQAKQLHTKAGYGTLRADQRVELSLFEALFLLERRALKIVDSRGRGVTKETLTKKTAGTRLAWVRYTVFADMRKRGYVVKTALKFGADFRVYERGARPGKAHAKWVLFSAHENDRLTWRSFAAKSRVAHGTKKNLLVAVGDDEGDVTYWEARWRRP